MEKIPETVYDWLEREYAPQIAEMSLFELVGHLYYHLRSTVVSGGEGPTQKVLFLLRARSESLGVSEERLDELIRERGVLRDQLRSEEDTST